jgi:hypothetical protein
VNAVLRVVEWVEKWVFRISGVVVEGITAMVARVLRRGRFRPWRRGV